jgi:hypothetical protein
MTEPIITKTITPKKLLTLAEQLTLDRLVHQNGDEPDIATEEDDEQPVLSQAEAEKRFLAEVAAFEQLKPELLKTHYGQVVAIYQEQVAVVGQTREAVLREMGERFGNVPCYIEWVEENVPRRMRITNVRRARR